jgi:hypothetical protein
VARSKKQAEDAADAPPVGAAEGESAAELAEAAFDRARQQQVAEAIEKLTPEEAQIFLEVLEKRLQKSKIQIWGYVTAGVTLLVTMLGVLIYWGSTDTGTFIGWIMMIPFLLVGAILWGFGRWANRIE